MPQATMNLKVLLPFEVFTQKAEVSRVVVETRTGSMGLLPRRLDCVTALAPGILAYETEIDGEVFLAVDEGVMVKVGANVIVCVRRALGGKDLHQLRDLVEKEYLTLNERERDVRSVAARLEAGFLRRFERFQNE